jgi:hypothetical protein
VTSKVVVARKNGLLAGPDGSRIRITRGKTYADAGHPAVTEFPEAWADLPVTLAADGPAPQGEQDSGAPGLVADLQARIEELEETAGGYREQLQRMAQLMIERGYVTDETNTQSDGWLVRLVTAVLDRLGGTPDASPDSAPAARHVTYDEIRTWARKNGISVKDSGRLPAAVIAQYQAAHGG